MPRFSVTHFSVTIQYTVQSRFKAKGKKNDAPYITIAYDHTFDTQEKAEARAKKLSSLLEYRILECTETRRIVAEGVGADGKAA